MAKKLTVKRQRIKYSASYHVYMNVGGCFSSSVEASSKRELLKKIEEVCRHEKDRAEVVTFEPIKKTIEISEAKGKFTVFRKIRNPFITNSKFSRYYNKLEPA